MIYALLILGLIAFFDLRRTYKTCTKGQSVIITLLFAGIMAICLITASGTLLKSPIVMMGDLIKSIGLSYPPLQ
jgi:FtsH-binding integral membrane protein